MKKKINCPICHQMVYNDIGKGCKMCGMHLEDEGKEFCCKTCRKSYKIINHK